MTSSTPDGDDHGDDRPHRATSGVTAPMTCFSCPMLARARRVRTRAPTKRSIAGVSVTATSTATTMQNAPTVPITPMKWMPVMFSASNATIDRRPGEDDGVARRARREADRLVQLHALPQLLSMPVDDEERVVDADGESEHHAEHRADRRLIHDAGERQREQHADPDAHERVQQRKARRDEGAEHDEQHDTGEHETGHLADTDDLGRALRR